jgi:hypothetical protein
VRLDPFAAPCLVCRARSGEPCDLTLLGPNFYMTAECVVHADRRLLAQVQQFGYDALELFGFWRNANWKNGERWMRFRDGDGWVIFPSPWLLSEDE